MGLKTRAFYRISSEPLLESPRGVGVIVGTQYKDAEFVFVYVYVFLITTFVILTDDDDDDDGRFKR